MDINQENKIIKLSPSSNNLYPPGPLQLIFPVSTEKTVHNGYKSYCGPQHAGGEIQSYNR